MGYHEHVMLPAAPIVKRLDHIYQSHRTYPEHPGAFKNTKVSADPIEVSWHAPNMIGLVRMLGGVSRRDFQRYFENVNGHVVAKQQVLPLQVIDRILVGLGDHLHEHYGVVAKYQFRNTAPFCRTCGIETQVVTLCGFCREEQDAANGVVA